MIKWTVNTIQASPVGMWWICGESYSGLHWWSCWLHNPQFPISHILLKVCYGFTNAEFDRSIDTVELTVVWRFKGFCDLEVGSTRSTRTETWRAFRTSKERYQETLAQVSLNKRSGINRIMFSIQKPLYSRVVLADAVRRWNWNGQSHIIINYNCVSLTTITNQSRINHNVFH